jgi:hypothetical protein
MFEWTVDNTPQADVYEDPKAKKLVKDLVIGQTVYFYDFFGLTKGVVIEDNFIRQGNDKYPNGNQWKAEKAKDGWHIAYGINEKAIDMLEGTS